jgi:HAMP domain-containing protein
MKAPAALVLLMFFSFPALAQTPAPVQRNEVRLSKCLESLSDEQLAAVKVRSEFARLFVEQILQAPPELQAEAYKIARPHLEALAVDALRFGLPFFRPSTNQAEEHDPIVDCSKLQTIPPLKPKDELRIWESLVRALRQSLKDSASEQNELRSMLKEVLERNAQFVKAACTSPSQSPLAEKQREFEEAARRLDEMRDRWLRDELLFYLQQANQILLRHSFQP